MDYLEKSKARSERRAEVSRLKQKRKNYWGHSCDNPMSLKSKGIIANTSKVCSGFCCGNPRKWFKEESLKEKSFFQIKFQDES